MSVYVSAYVWEHSAHKGSELLLLLAIADCANREGMAYPSMKRLARYLRMSQRNTRRVLRTLETSGELRVKMNAGPQSTNLFQVQMNETIPLFPVDNSVDKRGDNLSPQDIQGRKGRTSRRKTPDTAMSPEPSGTVIMEPAAAATMVPSATSEAQVIHKQGAAAADLIWPPNLPHGQQAAIAHYLKANPSPDAQQLLDELEGVMRDEAVRDPVAFFLHIAKEQAAGKFLPSHAHRVQVEREGEAVERALRAHPNP